MSETTGPLSPTAEVGVLLHLRPEGYRLYPVRCGEGARSGRGGGVMAEFEFHMRVVQCDREGYYFPRWDKATPIVARGATKQDAINKAAAAMGECPRGRGWYWGFKVDHIEAVA